MSLIEREKSGRECREILEFPTSPEDPYPVAEPDQSPTKIHPKVQDGNENGKGYDPLGPPPGWRPPTEYHTKVPVIETDDEIEYDPLGPPPGWRPPTEYHTKVPVIETDDEMEYDPLGPIEGPQTIMHLWGSKVPGDFSQDQNSGVWNVRSHTKPATEKKPGTHLKPETQPKTGTLLKPETQPKPRTLLKPATPHFTHHSEPKGTTLTNNKRKPFTHPNRIKEGKTSWMKCESKWRPV